MAVIVVEITMIVDMTEDMMTVNITAADHTEEAEEGGEVAKTEISITAEGDLPLLTTAEVGATDPAPGPDPIRLVVIEE